MIISILQSCWFGCDCTDETFYFSLNKAEIKNLNNSVTYPTVTEENEMHSRAVAFSISLFDSTDNYYYPYQASLKETDLPRAGFGIQSAYAWSCDCPLYFKPVEEVDRVEVITTYPINQDIAAGDNVVDLFLSETYGYPMNGLYASLERVLEFLYSKRTESPVLEFHVFFQPRVQNSLAEFTFNFYLSTGDVISAKTNEISIID
ncbi:MAG: hypothetical protein RBT74_09020 [Tenuifilaceae bacterium]|nr:hypothetical protein [Tenuifilaceae bacterium]